MGKKSFIGGLGSLLEDSFSRVKKDKKPTDSETEELEKKIAYLEAKLIRQEEELRQWRSGALSKEIFLRTLREHNLIYIESLNTFEKTI